jgi:transposase
MTKPEQYHIAKHVSVEELNRMIKTLEKSTKVLKRLFFIKYRYEGDSVEEASRRVGITKRVGYIWQERWNKEGYKGLIPRYAGGRPSKLSERQKAQLKRILEKKDPWSTEEVRELIAREFNIKYTQKQIRIILKKLGMKHGKPYPHDYRRPKNAEDILKKNSQILMRVW